MNKPKNEKRDLLLLLLLYFRDNETNFLFHSLHDYFPTALYKLINFTDSRIVYHQEEYGQNQ